MTDELKKYRIQDEHLAPTVEVCNLTMPDEQRKYPQKSPKKKGDSSNSEEQKKDNSLTLLPEKSKSDPNEPTFGIEVKLLDDTLIPLKVRHTDLIESIKE